MNLLNKLEGELALKCARSYAESAVTHIPLETEIELPEIFNEKRGVFVTLTENNALRGCIGYPYPVISLKEALKDASVHAALYDPRFMPVTENELQEIKIEVTILTKPEILSCRAEDRPSNIIVGKHGLIAQMDCYSGLLLPQVAEEYNWNAEEFLSQTCVKAGMPAKSWKSEECIIQTFEGQIFSEI